MNHVYSMKIDSTSVVFLDIIKCLQYSYLSFFFSLSLHTQRFFSCKSIDSRCVSRAVAMAQMSKCCQNIQLIIECYIFCVECAASTRYILFLLFYTFSSVLFFSFPFLLFFFTLFESKPIKAKKPTGYSATIRQRCIHIHILREFVGIILSSSKSIQFSCDRHRVCVRFFFDTLFYTEIKKRRREVR